MTNLSLKVFK